MRLRGSGANCRHDHDNPDYHDDHFNHHHHDDHNLNHHDDHSGPATFGTNVSVEATESDIPCGDYYCYSLYATISDIGWPSPKDPPVDLGTVTFWSGRRSTSVQHRLGRIRSGDRIGQHGGPTQFGGHGDLLGWLLHRRHRGEVTIQSAFGSTTVTSM